MKEGCQDLLAEYRGLASFCETLTSAQWFARSALTGGACRIP